MDRDFCGGSSERSPGRGRRVIGEQQRRGFTEFLK
jgi:hypothetical protein